MSLIWKVLPKSNAFASYTHTLWKPNHGLPNASGYLTHLPCSSADSSVQCKNRTGPETRTNNCLICRALACCMRLGAVPIAAYFVFSHCNAIFEPKKCNGNCSERCTVKPKIRERCATRVDVSVGGGKRQEETGNEQLNLSFAVAGLQATFLFMPSSDVLPSPAWQNCSRQFVWQNARWRRSPTTSQAGPDLFAYVPDVQLPGRFQSLASVHLRSLLPAAVVECVQHVTDTIEMENDLQHDTSSSHGSTISWAAAFSYLATARKLKCEICWNLQASPTLPDYQNR